MKKRIIALTLISLWLPCAYCVDKNDSPAVNKETIALDGKTYDIGLARAVALSMSSFNKIVRQELLQKAQNPKHKLHAVIKRVLKEHGLVNENGEFENNIAGLVQEYEKRRNNMTLLDFLKSGGNLFEFEKQ